MPEGKQPFTRTEIEFGQYRYATPCGWYDLQLARLASEGVPAEWVLFAGSVEVGRFETPEATEVALEKDIYERMWH